MTKMLQKARRLLVPAALLLPLAAGQAPGQEAAGPPGLKTLPAEHGPAAFSAMMLGVARAGKRIVAVGDHGIVLLSDDGGKSFRQARTVPVRSTLTSVSFADEKRGWAAGHWGVIIATVDGGDTWQLQRSETSLDQPLFSLYFKDKDRGWAVGLWSLVLATQDGGRSWKKVQLPAPPGGGKTDRNLFRVFASAKGTLLIAAEQGTVLRSNDGLSWEYASTGYKGSFWAGTGLPDGTLVVAGLRGTIYRSRDDGKSWTPCETEAKSSITDLLAVGGKVYAVALDGVSLESTDRGATFRATQRQDRAPLTALTAGEDGRLVAFSKQGVVEDFAHPLEDLLAVKGRGSQR
ncbi:MAG: glycosyl hydrolase [Deltaproteobacteria bacterium]|nr:glycosyl hydrolase [Deltaproteobacteria bacterium]